MQSASKRARQSASPSKTVVTDPGPCRKQVSCQIQGCTANLLALKEYNQRFKICKEHQQAESVERDGGLERFCQQCARFHDLSCFDGLKRSCRNSLVHLNERRRKAKALGKYSVQVKSTGDCLGNSQEKQEISSLSETALPRQKHSIGFDAGDAQQGSAPGEQHMMPRASIFGEGVPRLTQMERRTEFGPVLWAGLHQNYEEPHLPSRSEAFPDRAAGRQGLPVRGGGITEDAHGGGCPPIEGPRGEVPAGIGVGADDRNGDAWGAHRWPADSNCQDGAEALAADGTSGGQSTRGACESGHQQQDSMRGAEECHPAGILEGAGWADGDWPQPMPGARQWPWWPMVAAGWDAGPAPHGSGGSGLGPAAPRGLGGAVDQSCSSENVTALEDAAGPWQFWRGAGAGDAEDESSLRAGWGYWQARALHDPGSTRRADIAQEWERVYSDICGGQDPGGQSRIYHISMKLFSAKPTNLPDDLRLRLLSWLKDVPRDILGCIRPGCVHLTVSITLPSEESYRRALESVRAGVLASLLRGSPRPLLRGIPASDLNATVWLPDRWMEVEAGSLVASGLRPDPDAGGGRLPLALLGGGSVCLEARDPSVVLLRLAGRYHELESETVPADGRRGAATVKARLPGASSMGCLGWLEVMGSSGEASCSSRTSMSQPVPVLVCRSTSLVSEINSAPRPPCPHAVSSALQAVDSLLHAGRAESHARRLDGQQLRLLLGFSAAMGWRTVWQAAYCQVAHGAVLRRAQVLLRRLTLSEASRRSAGVCGTLRGRSGQPSVHALCSPRLQIMA